MDGEFEVFVNHDHLVCVFDLRTAETYLVRTLDKGTFLFVFDPDTYEAELYNNGENWVLLDTSSALELKVRLVKDENNGY